MSLLKHRASAQNGAIAYLHISSEQAVVHDHDFVSDLRIVSEMASHHEETFVSHACHGAFFCAAMDRYIFADAVVIADDDRAFDLGRVGVVLRRSAYDSAVAHGVVFAQCRIAFDDRMGLDHAIRTDHNAGSDDGSGTDFDIFAQTGFG